MSRVLTNEKTSLSHCGSSVGRKAKKELRHRAARQTEPDFQLTFYKYKLSWRFWEVRSQEITAFLTATLIWAHQPKPQGGDIILSWTLKFPSTGNGFNETITQKYSQHQNVCEILRGTAAPGSNVVLHNRQWIIILVAGETLSIWQNWGVKTVTDRLVSPHLTNAGCTLWLHPGIVSIWREIIPSLSSYAGELRGNKELNQDDESVRSQKRCWVLLCWQLELYLWSSQNTLLALLTQWFDKHNYKQL